MRTFDGFVRYAVLGLTGGLDIETFPNLGTMAYGTFRRFHSHNPAAARRLYEELGSLFKEENGAEGEREQAAQVSDGGSGGEPATYIVAPGAAGS